MGQEFIKNISSYDIILLRSDLIHLIDHEEWNLVYSGKSKYGLYTTQSYLNSLSKKITDISQLSELTFLCRTEECQINILELQDENNNHYKIPINVSYRLEYDSLKSTLILNNMGVGTIDTYRASMDPNFVRLFPQYKLIGNDFDFSIIIRTSISKELSSLRTIIRDKINEALNKTKNPESL